MRQAGLMGRMRYRTQRRAARPTERKPNAMKTFEARESGLRGATTGAFCCQARAPVLGAAAGTCRLQSPGFGASAMLDSIGRGRDGHDLVIQAPAGEMQGTRRRWLFMRNRGKKRTATGEFLDVEQCG